MARTHWAAAGIGVLLLLGTTTPAIATTTATTTVATQAAAAPVTKVLRSYGAGPVVLKGGSARISFTGHKGDIVHLNTGSNAKGSKTKLLLGQRKIRAAWPFYWKLPKSGTFTFSFNAAAGDKPGRKLQLKLVRVAETELDARPVRGRKEPRGYLNAVSFDLQEGERALLTSRDYRHTVLTPGGDAVRVNGYDLQLEDGRPIHTTLGDTGDADLGAGSVIVLSEGDKATRVTRSVVTQIATDGTIKEFTSDNKPREYVYTFDATAGDVVIPNFHDTPRWGRTFEAPDGVLQEDAVLSGAYWIDESGTARYSIITNGKSGQTTKLSLSKALHLPALTTLDAPITLANTKPGEYVAVELPPYPSPYPVGLTATEPVFTTTDGSTPTWSVHLEPSQPNYCAGDINAPLGCGEYFPISINQGELADVPKQVYGYTGNSLILAVPSTVTGKVTITLAKPQPR